MCVLLRENALAENAWAKCELNTTTKPSCEQVTRAYPCAASHIVSECGESVRPGLEHLFQGWVELSEYMC